MRVYIWPSGVYATSVQYSDPTLTRTTQQFDGAPGQRAEIQPRTTATVEGEAWKDQAADFDILRDRIRGGVHAIGLIDIGMRAQFGWDLVPAINSSGDEFWRADGNTSIYAGESDNAPTGPWRTVNATCNGGASADSTSLPVTGLLASEVIPKGLMIRVGDYRHRVAADVTANGSGVATLTLSSPLRAAVSNGAAVRIPGDFFVGTLLGKADPGPVDHRHIRPYRWVFREAYEDEITDYTQSPPVGFEYQV